MKSEKLSPSSPLRLDTVNQCLWSGTRNITLTPKAFLVLRYLMDRPGQLVTKEELLTAAWPKVYVSDAALKVCIRRLRQTLGDESRVPRFIETIPWRGYRFIGAISSLLPEGRTQAEAPSLRKSTKAPPLEFKVQCSKPKTQRRLEAGLPPLQASSLEPPPGWS